MLQSSKLLRQQLSVLFVSLAVSLVIMTLKWWAYAISGSVALKTDALESFINIVAVIMAITAIYHAQRPADSNHPYGHGKIELFSSAIEGGMLLFAGCYLIYESIQNLLNQTPVQELGFALIISSISGLMNGVLGAWQLRAGKRLQSEAILADAKHILSDFYTSIGIVVGLLIAKLTGYMFLDSVFAAAIALLLLKHSIEILKRSAMLLSDTEDPELIEQVTTLLNSELRPKDIIDVHRFRSFRSGNKNYIDLHIVVPEFWNVRQAHDAAENFCLDLKKSLAKESEFHPHVEACMRKYCTHCEVENCSIREAPLSEKKTFTMLDVIATSEEDE